MEQKVKVRVFASYQLGMGKNAKMIGGESENRFEVALAPASRMLREIEEILEKRHAEDVKKGLVPIIHHFQVIGF